MSGEWGSDVLSIAHRLWLYRKGGWDGRGLRYGNDEFGRKTLVLRLPGHRALVWAFWTWRDAEADEIRVEMGTTVPRRFRLRRPAASPVTAEANNTEETK